jgi:aryl-alcohol dehydrogenase-like predicted oxidoreductase
MLTGKYRKNQPPPEGSRIATGWNAKLLNDEVLDKVEKLIAFAESRDRTILELAFSWLLPSEVVSSVIAGAT